MARFFSAPKVGVVLGLVALAAVVPSSEAFCGFLNNNGNTPRGTGPLSAKVCILYNAPISPSTHTPHPSFMLVVSHQLIHASLSIQTGVHL